MVVIAAAAFLALGLLHFDFSRNWWRGQAVRLVIGVPLCLLYAYVAMPPLVFPQAITLLLITLARRFCRRRSCSASSCSSPVC